MYQTSWQADLHNFNTTEGAAIVANSCLSHERTSGDALMKVDGFPGLGIVALGGHTPGSTLFAVATDERLWLVSGDISNTKADLVSNTGKGILYSYLLVPEHTGRTEDLRQWLTELDSQDDMTVLVSHDLPDIRTRGIALYSR